MYAKSVQREDCTSVLLDGFHLCRCSSFDAKESHQGSTVVAVMYQAAPCLAVEASIKPFSFAMTCQS